MDVIVDNEFSFKIPSAPAFFVLKFDAWLDRHLLNDKDVKDMSFILANYYLHEITSPAHLEVLDVLPEPFEPFVAGAYMIAKDSTFTDFRGGSYLTNCIRGKGFREVPTVKKVDLPKVFHIRMCTDGFYNPDSKDDSSVIDILGESE